MSQFYNRTSLSNNDNAQVILLDSTASAGNKNQRTPVTQVLRSGKDLSDLNNNLTALNNLQLPNGVLNIQKGIDITLVNSGGNNTTTFDITGKMYIQNTKSPAGVINITLPVMNSTTAGQKSIAVGQSLWIQNTTIIDGQNLSIVIKDSGGSGVLTIPEGQTGILTLIDNGTSTGTFATQIINTLLNETTDLLTTSNATPSVISTIPVPETTGVLITAKVVGKRSGSVNGAWGIFEAAASRASGGTITQIGTTYTDKGVSTTEDVSIAIDAASNSFLVYVQGVAATTYNWKCTYTTEIISD